MPKDNIFNNLGWSVIKDNKLLYYPVNSANNESHKNSIERFIIDHNINIENNTSFEISINLATNGYICCHSNLLAFIPNEIKIKATIETLKKLLPTLQTFDQPTSLVCFNEDGSFDIYAEFNWQPL